jgi:hypothetical protein
MEPVNDYQWQLGGLSAQILSQANINESLKIGRLEQNYETHEWTLNWMES